MLVSLSTFGVDALHIAVTIPERRQTKKNDWKDSQRLGKQKTYPQEPTGTHGRLCRYRALNAVAGELESQLSLYDFAMI